MTPKVVSASMTAWSRRLPEPLFRPVPIPVLVVGLYGGLQALLLYHFSTYAAAEPTTHGLPFGFSRLWLGAEGGPGVGSALMTANLVVAVLLWGCYRVNRKSIQGRRWVLQLSYITAAMLLASLQWGCRFLTESLPPWVLTQIYP